MTICSRPAFAKSYGSAWTAPPQQLQLTGCNVTLPPGAENQSANRKPEERPAHVDANERPRIRFESGEHGNSGVFHEHKRKPAGERDLETAERAFRVQLPDQYRERVIDDDGGSEGEQVGPNAVRVLDIGSGFSMKIQPRATPNSIPTPADQEIHDGKYPNSDVIDSSVHSGREIDMIRPIFTRPKSRNPVN